MALSHTIVIGYGNFHRQDDGVGHYIVQEVERQAGESIDTVCCHQLGIEQSETIKDYDIVIFADAYVGHREEDLKVASLEATFTQSAFTHHLKPDSLLALTQNIFQKTPKAYIVSVKGYDFDFGTDLSTRTQKWADIAVKKILELSGISK
ncbi:hydrogenase maturation protease [Candidatus Poribacteria bacterium]|nr:hydrogenase maturation protease [Candidatus Poribacteria bacterium]